MTYSDKALRFIASLLDSDLSSAYGRRMGFALVVFQFGVGGVGDYISNGERSDIIKAMRETADRLEKKQDIPVPEGEAH